jgi:ABC-type amino acid transport substrate-binding protein/signal transduction histidine kinase
VVQITSIYLSIVRGIVTFPTAKQFAVLLIVLTFTFFSFFPDIAFSQTKPDSSATLHSPEDNLVVFTPEEQAWLEAHPNIRLGYIDSAEPEVIVSQDGSHTGMLVDFLAELNRRLGMQIGLDIDTIPGILEQAKTNKVDGILEMHPEYADKLGLLKTETYLTAYPAVFGRRSDINIGLADIAGKKVAISDKIYFSEKIAQQYCSEATIVKVSDSLEGLRLISSGDVDFFIGVSFDSYLLVKYHLFDLAVKHVFFDLPSRFGMAIRADWPELVSVLNKGITSFTENEMDAFMTKWFHFPQQEKTVEFTPEERTWLENNSEVTLGYADSQEPQLIVNSDGSYSGIVVDLLDELNRRLGTSFKLAAFPIKELFPKAQSKGIDGILNLNPSYAERLEMLKTIEYFEIFPALFARKDLVFNGPEDIPGKTVAIIDKLYFSEKILKEYEGQVTIKRVKSALEGLESLQNGEADIFIGVSHNSYFVSKYQLYDVAVKYIYTDWKERTVIAVRPDWPVLVSILNKGLRSFSDMELKQIVAKWVHLPQQEKTVEFTPEEQTLLKAHQPIRLGFVGKYPPYLMTDEKNLQSGIFDDLRDELSLKLGVDIEIAEFNSFTDLLQASEKKEIDAVYAIMPSRAKKRGLLPTEVFLSSYAAIFTRHGKRVVHLEDVIGKTVAMVKDMNFLLRILKPYLEQVTIVAADTPADGLRLLSEGKVDMFIGTTTNSFMVNKFRINGISQAYIHTDEGTPFAMGVRPDRPELVTVLNKGLAHIGQRGIETIVARWLKIQEPEERVQLNGTERAWLEQNQTVRVRMTDWPPYMIINENKPPQGITVEYLRLIEEKTGINFEYEVTKQPFAEFLESMKQHQGPDMAPLIIQTPDREQYLSFSAPYISSPYVIFGREQDELLLDITGLAGKTVAVPRGFVMQELLERDFPAIKLLLFDDDEQALLAVSTGKADGYIGNLTAASHIIQKRGLSNLRVAASTPYGDQFLSMGNRSDWPELTSIINKALASISEEEKTAIHSKYVALRYKQGIDKAVVLRWIIIFVVVATTVLVLFIVWNWLLHRKVGIRTADLEAEIVARKQVVAELIDSEEKFRGLVEQSPLSIQIFNHDGHTLQVNKAWQELWGFSDEDLPEVLKEYNVLEDEEAMRLGLIPLIKKAFKGEVVTLPVIEYDASITMVDLGIGHVEANKRWVQSQFYPVRNSKGDIVNVVDIEEDISVRKQAEEEILNYQQRLKSLASQLTIVEEKERSHIAADLHDNIGQTLAYSRIQIARAKKYASEEKLANILEEISQSLLKTIQDTKDLVFELSSPVLNELGLHSAILHWLEENVSGKHGIEFELVGANVIFPLSVDLRAILFRNVRELLTNVIRHAKASKVIVSLVENEIELKCIVTDNGIGLDIQELKEKEGAIKKYGLFSIKERMEDMGGSMEIISEPGKGCKAILSTPLDSRQEQGTV